MTYIVKIEDNRDLLERLEHAYLYANQLWVFLVTLLAIGLPGIIGTALIRAFT